MDVETNRHTAGLTLVELMIAISATAVLVLIVSMILTMTFSSWRNNNAYAEIRRDISYASSILSREIRESSFDGLNPVGNTLSVESAVTNKTVVFFQADDALIYTSDTDSFPLIPRNLQTFTANKQSDGIELFLVVANTDFALSVTNQLFVNTRN